MPRTEKTFYKAIANIFDIMGKMNEELPWLKHCVNHIEVTNIGENYDLLVLFKAEEF